MKPSPDRTFIAEHFPELLDLPPADGLFQVGLRINVLKLEHAATIASLRKLEHSYRTAERWSRTKQPKQRDEVGNTEDDYGRLLKWQRGE